MYVEEENLFMLNSPFTVKEVCMCVYVCVHVSMYVCMEKTSIFSRHIHPSLSRSLCMCVYIYAFMCVEDGVSFRAEFTYVCVCV